MRFTLLLFLVFGLCLQGAAQKKPDNYRPPYDPRATQADDEAFLAIYRQRLRRNPLLIVSLESLAAQGEEVTLEWLAKASILESRPRFALQLHGRGGMVLPQQPVAVLSTSVKGNDLSSTEFLPSLLWSLGASIELFKFRSKSTPTPFERDAAGNYPIRKYLSTPPFWSLIAGLEYQQERTKYDQTIDMGFRTYILGLTERRISLELPVGLRWNFNLIDKKQWNAGISSVNINQPYIQSSSLFVGTGLRGKFIMQAERNFFPREQNSNIFEIFNYINSEGEDGAAIPYWSSIRDEVFLFQWGWYAELGARFRIKRKGALPQYLGVSFQYHYPFLFNMPLNEIEERLQNIGSTIEDNVTEPNPQAFSTGYRNILLSRSRGKLSLRISYDLHCHRTIRKTTLNN